MQKSDRIMVDGKYPLDTQRGQILAWLKSGRPLTPLEAMRNFGCFRLGARIHELRKAGYNITSTLVEETKEDGSHCRYAVYRLIEERR